MIVFLHKGSFTLCNFVACDVVSGICVLESLSYLTDIYGVWRNLTCYLLLRQTHSHNQNKMGYDKHGTSERAVTGLAN